MWRGLVEVQKARLLEAERTVWASTTIRLLRASEQTATCTLALRAPAYLPLRTFTDLDVDGERAAQADPVLGILSALGDLPAGWRGLSQRFSCRRVGRLG